MAQSQPAEGYGMRMWHEISLKLAKTILADSSICCVSSKAPANATPLLQVVVVVPSQY
jgi:hypothetical protein